MIFRQLAYKLLIAVSVLALASCTEKPADITACQDPAFPDGRRVISISFGPDTKITLDGLQPVFEPSDQILISNGTQKEICQVQIDGAGKASISTDLTGRLKAVFPAAAALTDANNAITGINIPATQTGLLKDAILATADIYDNSALFSCQTAILCFYVDASIGVKSLTVSSSGMAKIATGAYGIKVDPDGDDTLISSVTTGNADSRLCYVAIRKDTYAGDLTFTAETNTQGIVTRKSPSTATLLPGNIYDSFIPYYIKVKVSDTPETYMKWAYCNLGAFLPEEAGKYYPWADTEGHRYNGTSFDGTISWSNYKYANGAYSENPNVFTVFTKYVSTSDAATYWNAEGPADNKLSIEPKDDAAVAALGGNWRIPTCDEHNALATAVNKEWNDADKGYFFGTAPARIFLPARGYAKKDSTLDHPEKAFYWSSTLTKYPGHTGDYIHSSHAFYLRFSDSEDPYAYRQGVRPNGMLIRPIYIDPESLDIKDYDPIVIIE